MLRRFYALVFGIVLVTIAVTGCGGGGVGTTTNVNNPPPDPPPSETTTASIRGFVNWGGTYTVTLKRNNQTVGTPVVTSASDEPPFAFTNVPVAGGYTLEVDGGQGILTIVRPFAVPAKGLVNVDVLTRKLSQLEEDQWLYPAGITLPPNNGTVALVAYSFTGQTPDTAQIVLDSGTPSPVGNPTWVTDVTGGNHQIKVLPDMQTPFTITLPANHVVIIRSLFHREPQAGGD